MTESAQFSISGRCRNSTFTLAPNIARARFERHQLLPSSPSVYSIIIMDIVSSMLDLMRRLPPTKIEENVEALVQISPDYADDLSGNVDQPLKLRVDKATGKEYLACVYNQDGESYRCAFSHSLTPAPPGLFTDVAGRLGRTSMILRQRMALSLLQNCVNLRSRRTRRSIRIASCEVFHSPQIWSTPSDRDVMLDTSKAAYHPSFCGISRTAVSQEWCF